MRLFIERGWLIEEREITDGYGGVYTDKLGEPYIALVAFQVYDERGAPSTRSYHGAGIVDGTRIIIGDPHKETTLLEGKIDRQATSESWDHYQGYKAALTAPKLPSPKQYQARTATATEAWRDGYQEGYAHRKMRGVKKPKETVS